MTLSVIRLVSANGEGLLAEWRPADGKMINVVAANDKQAVCACGANLYYFELGPGQITLVKYVI